MRLVARDVLGPVNRGAAAVARAALVEYLGANPSDSGPAEECRIVVGLLESRRVQQAAAD